MKVAQNVKDEISKPKKWPKRLSLTLKVYQGNLNLTTATLIIIYYMPGIGQFELHYCSFIKL